MEAVDNSLICQTFHETCLLSDTVQGLENSEQLGPDTLQNSLRPSRNRGLGGDVPGGPVVKNAPCNAGDSSSTSDPGTKIPHAVGRLGLCTATTEPSSCI